MSDKESAIRNYRQSLFHSHFEGSSASEKANMGSFQATRESLGGQEVEPGHTIRMNEAFVKARNSGATLEDIRSSQLDGDTQAYIDAQN